RRDSRPSDPSGRIPMSSESVELRSTLGGLTNSGWSGPLETVRREHFLGEAVFRPAEGPEGPVWEPIRRDRVHPDRWLAMAYADETWVTQVNGVMAEDATGAMTGENGRRACSACVWTM